MIKKLLLILAITVVIIMGVSACTEKDLSEIQESVDFLCSRECYGRLPGTEGNAIAQNFIVDKFEDAGLSFYGNSDSYLVPYTQDVFDSTSSSQSLTLTYGDGSTEIFYSGMDFYPYLCKNGSFVATRNYNSKGITTSNEVAFCINSGLFSGKEIIFSRADRATSRISSAIDPIPFSCNEVLFYKISDAICVTFQDNLEILNKDVNNVVGVLKGTDRNYAVIISAHFDHVGGYGETYYPGALDNASGVSALLEIIKELVGNQFDFDIVFVAFNGEEMGQLGSQAFVKNMNLYKKAVVVNIDSIADIDGNGIQIIGDKGLQHILGSAWQEENVQVILNQENIISDHISFQSANIPAVTISSSTSADELISKSHITTDNATNIDIAQIDYVAQLISDYIKEIDSVESILDNITISKATNRNNSMNIIFPFERASDVIAESGVNFQEAISFELDGILYLARDITPYKNILAMAEYDPTFEIPRHVEDFSLQVDYPLINMTSPNIDESLGIIIYKPSDALEYVPEKKYPLPEELKQHTLELSYRNSSGERLIVLLRNRSTYSLEETLVGWDKIDTVEINNGTLFIEERIWEDGGSYFSGMVYTNSEIPWDIFFLKHDLFSSITYEDVMDFYNGTIAEFIEIPLIH